MKNIHIVLEHAVHEALREIVRPADAPVPPFEVSLSGGFGDLSLNAALKLGSLLKAPPRKIADQLVEYFRKNGDRNGLSEFVREIKAEGPGFINFYLKDDYFRGQLKDILSQKSDFGRSDAGAGKKVLIEFVSANPTGPLSVAHARQAAVGDALANVLSFLGFSVQREYYLNDEGNQINILGRSIETRLAALNGANAEFPENYYQGDYITGLARRIKEKNLAVKDFSEYGVKEILAVIEKELRDFGVVFDCWYSQKTLRESGKIDAAFALLKDHLYKEEGATWFRSTPLGDDKDRVVIKSDGSYTYLAPDIAYHCDKYKRGFSWLINLWGPDHHGYINRLKASVAALGHDPDSLSVIIVQLASIFRNGKPVEMSTRRGQYISLREVLDEVGVDAARFFFLMRRTSSQLSFDLEVAKKQTAENPVYYVQYAYARICSILRSGPEDCVYEEADLTLLKETEELQLIRKLWQFPYTLHICRNTIDPYMLTVYLQETAEVFHKFYDKHRVLGQAEEMTKARLALIKGVETVIGIGLGLLGVSKPQKM
ncbi:MAG: arginine--tRNA ligase [Candidatus Omnitrophica bacterium]|nr:arginine--tRNA ligase [Candidatus Omnitrophota bacterium]